MATTTSVLEEARAIISHPDSWFGHNHPALVGSDCIITAITTALDHQRTPAHKLCGPDGLHDPIHLTGTIVQRTMDRRLASLEAEYGPQYASPSIVDFNDYHASHTDALAVLDEAILESLLMLEAVGD